MSILRIKDALGRWIKIVSIKGDKGDEGKPGKVQDVKVNGTSVVGSDGVANIQQSGGGGAVNDVKLDGVSCVTDGVANVPIASTSAPGVVIVDTAMGTSMNSSKKICVVQASNSNIDARNNGYRAVTSNNLDYAVKAALCDGKGAAYTDAEKAAARLRLGIDAYVEAKIREILGTAKWKVTWKDYVDYSGEDPDREDYWTVQGRTLNVSFKSNGTAYSSLTFHEPPELMKYGTTEVWQYEVYWHNPAYKICVFDSDPRGLFLGDWAYFLNANALSIEQIYE